MDIAAERSFPTPYANSTWLPILLLSIVAQKNAPDTTKHFCDEYDVIVVGGGSGGSVVASRLSENPNINVLLLEAGRVPPILTEVPAICKSYWHSDIDWKFYSTPLKHTGCAMVNQQVVLSAGKVLGGSSILNEMMYVRGNKKNYDDWEAQGAKGWSYKDVLPYFLKLEDNRSPEHVANGYHNVGGPVTVENSNYHSELHDQIEEAAKKLGFKIVDSNGPTQTGFYDLQQNVRNGQRCSAAKAYLVPAENRPNLGIATEAMVRKILIKNGKAVGVEFDLGGKMYQVRATQEVIMSAGAINTPKLLMLSGIGPKEDLEKLKIQVVADLPVGENLQNHYGASVDFLLDPSIEPLKEKFQNPVHINEYLHKRKGPLASSYFCSYMAFLSGLNQTDNEDFPRFLLSIEELSTDDVKKIIGLKENVFEHVYGPYKGKAMYSCVTTLLQTQSTGTVKLSSTDPYDPPVVDANYFAHPQDIKDVVEGMKVCRAIGNSEAMKRIGSKPFDTLYPGCEEHVGNDDLYFECQLRSMVLTYFHQSGTAKMGDPQDPTTVVDPQLRVKGVKNLRVVDASIMPSVPSGNTNIPTIMIAEKASDIMKESLKGKLSTKDGIHSSSSIFEHDTEHHHDERCDAEIEEC